MPCLFVFKYVESVCTLVKHARKLSVELKCLRKQ